MENQKKWPFVLIFTVIALTIYNILPTIFYYAQPLKSPVAQEEGMKAAVSIADRLNSMEKDSIAWLHSYCDLLRIKPASIAIDKDSPQFIQVQLTKSDDAERLRSTLPRAGSLIPFVPSQLTILPDDRNSKTVMVQRRIPIHFDETSIASSFAFTTRLLDNGALSPTYVDLIIDRAATIAAAAAGTSENALLMQAVLAQPANSDEYLLNLASQIKEIASLFKGNETIQARFCAHLTQGTFKDRSQAISRLISAMDALRDRLKHEKMQLQKKSKEAFLAENGAQTLKNIEKKGSSLASAASFLKKQLAHFQSGHEPLAYKQALDGFRKNATQDPARLLAMDLQTLSPFFGTLAIDCQQSKISLTLQPDIVQLREEWTGVQKDRLEQLLINEMARISRLSDETWTPGAKDFSLALHSLTDAQSFLIFKLAPLAKQQSENISHLLRTHWHPLHPDLLNVHFPIVDSAGYKNLNPLQKKLCLVLYAPASDGAQAPKELKKGSIYVVAKGLDRILAQANRSPNTEAARSLQSDFALLASLLQRNGFLGYPGSSISLTQNFAGDYVFERADAFGNVIAATREDFRAKGSKRFAVLEFSDREQRILTENRIDTCIHEDLLKWRDEYAAAQVSLQPASRFDVPQPTKSVFWNNQSLSFKKLFRGDDRKIIRWGLDLSGGKTVQIELRDQNNRLVTNESDLKQGINELFNRVNKMGVSEVAIRRLGNNIVLDFPGSQAMSASELVKASSMYFHVVNEKFSTAHSQLADVVNRFLQEVWNEAVVMNRKDPQSINMIAWKHLFGDTLDPNAPQPQSDAARILYENGLRLLPPNNPYCCTAVNDSVSKIAIMRGKDFSEWHNQTHPLLFVFCNYALEGSNLSNIRSAYDPSKGNFLSFEVKGSTINPEGQKLNPRDELHAWTNQFSKERIVGTANEAFSHGQGWRMAVVLNDTVISAPTLSSALRDSAMISGNFSQREVNQLASDLKAGSLTFTPHILSEKNVSPELGQSDRIKGIVATFVALVLVIVCMLTYYRFSGLIATAAVLFNLLIMWATLQNLHATLTLAGIAGVILTVAMAVDANVLVFERFKEEFAISGRLGASIQAGYKKAFSAILDSNVTTIIAALILLNFDAGPIKGFAITLIIGIASSMFTALFMTRTYFSLWIRNPAHKTLTMMNWIRSSSIDFLKKAKWAFAVAFAIIIVGMSLFFANRSTIFGMDFTGGFAVTMEIQPQTVASGHYAAAVEDALIKHGLTAHDFQIRELNPSNHLRVLFSTSMEQSGKPFYDLGDAAKEGKHNPRVQWTLKTLKQSGISLTRASLSQIDTNWTAMSGQMSESMRNNALIGLALAFTCIFIYLAIRFESAYAASAIICVIHDVFISLGLIGILYYFGVPIQIDLNTVAALMTIVGYSLNDTIIVFDRIREEVRLMRGQPIPVIVNHALNATLSRTSITSLTTLLVLMALIAFGGPSIFSFAAVMIIGVVFGTLSSWFIAAPVLIYFQTRRAKNFETVEVIEPKP
ncbi:MAG: secDF [Parachlamydiales bacterium]|nr:secDF [Parachlamydiales bacterium]